MGAAMLGVLWAYEGWHFITFSAGEVVEPQKKFRPRHHCRHRNPRCIYLLANVAYVAALGVERSAASERIAAEAVAAILGPGAGKLIALAILISMFSAANAVVLTGTRVYFAMAQDGLFFERMGSIHSRWKTPAFAIIASCAWAAILAASGTFEQLLTYVVFTGWAFYALGAASIFYYRRTRRTLPVPFACRVIPGRRSYSSWSPRPSFSTPYSCIPARAAVGVGLILLGAPVYWFWRRRADRAPGATFEKQPATGDEIMTINRRHFMQAGGAAVAAGATLSWALPALGKSADVPVLMKEAAGLVRAFHRHRHARRGVLRTRRACSSSWTAPSPVSAPRSAFVGRRMRRVRT